MSDSGRNGSHERYHITDPVGQAAMSAEAIGWVYRFSPYTGATLFVHLALGDAANDLHEHEIWARQRTIAEKARVSRKTTNEALARMVADGFITLVEDHAADGKPNRYRFEFPMTPVVFGPGGGVTHGYTPHPGGVTHGDRGCNPRLHQVSPTVTPVTQENPTGTDHVGTADDADPGTTDFDRVGYRKDGTPSAASEIVNDGYPKEFQLTWERYPRREGKRAAYSAWRATVVREVKREHADMLETMRAINRATRNYAGAMADKEPQFVKLPATFYGPGDHWKDYVNAAPRATARRDLNPGDPGFVPESLR